MNDAELTQRVIAASGPATVDDLVTFMRKRIAYDRYVLNAVHCPVIAGNQHQIGTGGGTTALIPLGRFTAHLDAVERTLNKYEAALSHVLRGEEMGWEHSNSQAATVAYMDVIKLHALEYATHPDYKENWRP